MRRLALALVAAGGAFAALPRTAGAKDMPLDAPLPIDERYTVRETLASGLRIFVRRHEMPKGQVGMWLHVGSGSLEESEAERGLAHFLEHVAFRGSANFAPGSLNERFENLGVRFGRDQNAFTSFDQTTYQVYLPRTDHHAVSEGMLFLADVASRLSLVQREIDDERGVVLEETRARAGAQARLMERLLPLVAPGSRLAARLPIGLAEVVKSVSAADMRAFYERWYRPERAAVLIVGDIDPETVGAMARLAFAGWQGRKDAPPSPGPGLQPAQGLRFAIATDPEVVQADVSLLRVEPVRPLETVGDARDRLVERVGAWIARRRLDEAKRAGEAIWQDANVVEVPFAAGLGLTVVDMQSRPEAWREAARAMFVALKRVHVHGILDDEVERARAALLAEAEQQAERAASTPTGAVLAGLNQSIVSGRKPISEDTRLELARRFLPGITADEVYAALKRLYPLEEGVVMATFPERAGFTVPGVAELEALLAEVRALEVSAPSTAETLEHLLPAPTAAGEIADRKVNEALGATRLELANGIVAFLRPVADAGETLVTIRLHDGIVGETAEVRGITALVAAAMGGQQGAARTRTASQIAAWQLGRKLDLSVDRDATTVTIGIEASPQAVEGGLEWAHLLLTQGLVTPQALDEARTALLQDLEEQETSTQAQAMQRLRVRVATKDPRTAQPPAAVVAALTCVQAQAWWERLAAAPIEVVVAGKFDQAEMETLLRRWVATLPKRPTGGFAAWMEARRVATALAPGGETMSVPTITPTSVALVAWTGLETSDPLNAAKAQQVAQILTTRLILEVREKRGLTYSIQATPLDQGFRGLEMLAVFFTAGADQIEDATRLAREVVLGLRDGGPTEQEASVISMQMGLYLQQVKQQAAFWTSTLAGTETTIDGLDGVARGLEAVAKADAPALQAFLKQFVVDENYLHVIAKPRQPDGPAKDESAR